MIAPLRLTEESPPSSGLQSARRMVAAALLDQNVPPAPDVPRIRPWQAWLFVGWVITVGVAYCAHLVGLFLSHG
jgi:hypothetical protein